MTTKVRMLILYRVIDEGERAAAKDVELGTANNNKIKVWV